MGRVGEDWGEQRGRGAEEGSLIPDAEERVPGAGSDGHAVLRHAETRHAVVVAGKDTGALALHGVPDVAVEVVVAGQQQAARLAEGHGRDAADDVVVRVHRQLLVGADVEHAARRVVRARREREARREERNRIDIALVTREGLLTLAVANVPELGGRVAGPRYEGSLVGRERERHDVTRVARELTALLTGLDVPEGASHITRAGQDLVVIQEAAAGQVARVSWQLTRYAYIALACLQAINGADIIEPATRDIRSGGSVSARHHPRRPQRYRVHLVRRVAVPHDQLAVLAGGHEVPRVAAPVHRVDLGEVSSQCAARAHLDATDRLQVGRRLGERRVACRFTGIPDGILKGLRLLAQTV